MKDKYTGHPRGFGFIKFEDVTGGDFDSSEKHMAPDYLVVANSAVAIG